MSKQDTHFFNVFSLVIGLLVSIAVVLFALARIVASHTQDLEMMSEPDYGKAVAARIRPPSQVAVAGQDNSALAIKAAGPAAAGKGKATLYEHALQGFTGSTGTMPPKGGRTDVSDDLVKQAVDHMLQMAQ